VTTFYFKIQKKVSLYNHFVFPMECHEWSGGNHLRLLCAVGNAVTFVMNAALVAGQL